MRAGREHWRHAGLTALWGLAVISVAAVFWIRASLPAAPAVNRPGVTGPPPVPAPELIIGSSAGRHHPRATAAPAAPAALLSPSPASLPSASSHPASSPSATAHTVTTPPPATATASPPPTATTAPPPPPTTSAPPPTTVPPPPPTTAAPSPTAT